MPLEVFANSDSRANRYSAAAAGLWQLKGYYQLDGLCLRACDWEGEGDRTAEPSLHKDTESYWKRKKSSGPQKAKQKREE